MKPIDRRPAGQNIKIPLKRLPTHVMAIAAFACIFGPAGALAQAGKLGTYTGTIEVTGTELSPKVSYRASVK